MQQAAGPAPRRCPTARTARSPARDAADHLGRVGRFSAQLARRAERATPAPRPRLASRPTGRDQPASSSASPGRFPWPAARWPWRACWHGPPSPASTSSRRASPSAAARCRRPTRPSNCELSSDCLPTSVTKSAMRSFNGAIKASYCRNSLAPASLSRNNGLASAVRALGGLERLADRIGSRVALTAGGRRQQCHLRAAGIEQRDIGLLYGLQGAQLMGVEPLGRRADAPHVEDAERADERAKGRDHEETRRPA